MPVIAVFNQKGGVGKTTTTLNAARLFASTGHAVTQCPGSRGPGAAAGLGRLPLSGGGHRLSATLDVLEQRLGKRFHRRVVVTRFDARRRVSYDIYDMLVTRFGEQVCETAIAETVALAESPMHGKDIFSHAGNSQGAADYRALTDELRTGNFFT